MTDRPTESEPDAPTRRQIGLERMAEIYGWDVSDGDGDFFGMTVEHLFAEVWTRPGFSDRERRLVLLGLMVGSGLIDVFELQLDAALRLGELDDEQARELVILLTHYAGWPRGAQLNTIVENLLARRAPQSTAGG